MGLFRSLKGDAHPAGIIGGDSDANNPIPVYSSPENELDLSSPDPIHSKSKSKFGGGGAVNNKQKLDGFIGSGREYIPTIPGTSPSWQSNAGGVKSKDEFDRGEKLKAPRTLSSIADIDPSVMARKPRKATAAVEKKVEPSVAEGSSRSTGKEKKKSRFSLGGLRKPYEPTEEDLKWKEKLAMTPEEAKRRVLSQSAGLNGPPGAGQAGLGMASWT